MRVVACIVSMFLLVPALICAEPKNETFEFKGTHFMAEYFDCDVTAMSDTAMLMCVMEEAVQKSGATILGKVSNIFPGCGLTMVIMLSESHASLHTYPEHRSCFVDLFTCGDHCSFKGFDRVLRDYLKPGNVEERVAIRPNPKETISVITK